MRALSDARTDGPAKGQVVAEEIAVALPAPALPRQHRRPPKLDERMAMSGGVCGSIRALHQLPHLKPLPLLSERHHGAVALRFPGGGGRT